jgi:choice-of-anchor A domain-containing protein
MNFVQQVGTHNAIVTDQLTLDNSHTQSGVAAGGAVTLNNAVLNQTGAFTDSPYALRAYGQLTLAGSDQSLNQGAAVVKNAGTNAGLNDFQRNGGNQRVLTFGPNADAQPQLAFNGNSGPPAPANFLAAADGFFTSRAAALSAASATLSAAAARAPVSLNNGNKVRFSASANGAITVFDFNVGAEGFFNEIELDVPANSTAIINVFNAGAQWNPASFNFLGANLLQQSSRILWNLAGGLDLVTTNEWYGSILGLDSSIVANGNLNGQIFAHDLRINSRELHYVPFMPVVGAAIPEPAASAALAGLAAFALAYRRRRCPAD